MTIEELAAYYSYRTEIEDRARAILRLYVGKGRRFTDTELCAEGAEIGFEVVSCSCCTPEEGRVAVPIEWFTCDEDALPDLIAEQKAVDASAELARQEARAKADAVAEQIRKDNAERAEYHRLRAKFESFDQE